MKLKQIAEILNTTTGVDLDITGISYDSRNINSGNIFICLVGEKTDGHKYIKDAEEKGACAIVAQNKISTALPVIYTTNTQIALAKIANVFFGDPSKKIRITGVTGTNGKTTTTHLIQHIFEKHNIKTAIIGTLGTRESTSSKYYDAKHTTPQSPELQNTLSELLEKGFKNIAMEVSSHALSLNRVYETNFAGGVFTNLTQDHLDFHHTMEEYFKAKRILFEILNTSTHKNKFAIINKDDSYFLKFTEILKSDIKLITYGIKNDSDFQAKDIEYSFDGANFTLITPDGNFKVKSKLNGQFNIYNVLASICTAYHEGIPLEKITEYLKEAKEVEGRFQIISDSDSPICIVDYAHTPDGLENILKAARLMVKNGKLISVFGCGGDRDPTKRPKMGKISEELADITVITSDNPRSEEPNQIISDILSGINNTSNITVEADRKKAIELAINKANKNDIIVIAGKGHEDYQILKTKTIHFDDREEVKEALKLRKTSLNKAN